MYQQFDLHLCCAVHCLDSLIAQVEISEISNILRLDSVVRQAGEPKYLILIIWMNPLSFIGPSGVIFHFYVVFFSKQNSPKMG